ncbi:YolD-like family protein [Neobacillus cucumis]|uniref:YolD-like family protein n=1 Tax=Neobacillus cucumis TaxID=1740721 RepID=UPI0035A919AA
MKKPIIDVYVKEEFDLLICHAKEYNLPEKIPIWSDGFIPEITGRIQYLDPISHQLRIELQGGEFRRIDFGDVIELSVVD